MSADELKPRRRRRRLRRWLPWVLSAALVGSGWWAAFRSPLFAVEAISVQGAVVASEPAVIAASGIEVGDPIPAIDAAVVLSSARKLPEVLGVEVRRVLPHEVILVVTERVAVATTQLAPARWRLVDATGVRFGDFAERPLELPLIEAPSKAAREAAAAVAGVLPLWLRVDLDRVRGLSRDDVRLELRDGRRILWGGTDRAARKLQVLQPLLDLPAEVYDVSAPDVPTTRGKAPQP